MSESNQVEKSIGEQLADLLQRKPQNYDVLFSIGPEKVKVEAVKILLKAASPVFEREFDQNWDNAVVREGEGIPLPHLEAISFKLFVNLLVSDTWSLEALDKLSLPPKTVLNLLELCRRYKITKAIKNLEKAADDFIQNFNCFKDTAEFLEMSQESLETIFSCERIPLDEKEIFKSACRWAEHQCKQKKFEQTGNNWREVLGSSIFEIRFPTMELETFAKVSALKKNLLTMEEIVTIFHFIGMDEDEKAKFGKTQLLFNAKPRNQFGCSVLRFPKQYRIMNNPSFVCNGSEQCNRFQVNQKVSLHGIGFLGPISGDTQFDVTVRIQRYVKPSMTNINSGTLKKNIFAQKGKTFYFLFDAPIAIESNTYDSSWNDNKYYICYSLTGAQNVSQFKAEKPNPESVQISGVEFNLCYLWNSGKPLAELLFKKNEPN